MLTFVASAWATTNTYGPVYTWNTNDDAATSYNTSVQNDNFATNGAYLDTVVFIDNTGGWHNTKTITSNFNHTYWNGASGALRKAYCIYRDQFSTTGSCST
jgi:hypothetical protein